MKRLLLVPVTAALMVTGVLISTSGTAQADTQTCRGTIGARIVDDDLRVPRGATCVLRGTTVEGDVTVGRHATLRAINVEVGGDIDAVRGHRRVVVRNSDVDGDITLIRGGRNGAVSARVLGNDVDGEVRVDGIRGRKAISRNDVDDDVKIRYNRGATQVRRNQIDGDLRCKANSPAPTGFGNQVEGDKKGQCRRL